MRRFFRLKLIFILLANTFLFLTIPTAFSMEVAITVDDLPANGTLAPGDSRLEVANRMLAVFKKHHITHVYGFINGVHVEKENDGMLILQNWIAAGQLLGNHTFNHIDLAKVNSNIYITDIIRNESILTMLMKGKNYRYFRYPFLSEGNTPQKRDTIRQFLFTHGYQIAPVTIDFFDYEWNDPYVRCVNQHDQKAIKWLKQTYIEQALNALTISHSLSTLLFQKDIKNVLLIHINSFNADMLDKLLTAYEKQGVIFVTLPEALSDEKYNVNPDVVRDRTYTFLNQKRLARKLPNPPAIEKLYQSLPEEQLKKLCE